MTDGVKRLQSFGETVFATMTRAAEEHQAINLGQGFPDTSGPERMREIAAEELLTGNNQYAPARGVPALITAITEDRRKRLAQAWDPSSEVLVTVGATEGITAAVLGLVEPEDEVILLDPFYDAYAAAVALAGARRVSVPLKEVHGNRGPTWDLDIPAITAAISPRTRMIIVNSPHNPTGAVFSHEALKALARLAVERDFLVVSDEVYEHIIFDDVSWTPVASLPGMRDRTITVSSVAKSFNATGWKTGWVLAAPPLLSAVHRAKQFLTFTGVRPLQPAAAYAITNEQEWVCAMVAGLQRNRDALKEVLHDIGAAPAFTSGTFFQVADFSVLGVEDATQFCLDLPGHIGVAAVPLSAFSDHPTRWRSHVRFAFAKEQRTIADAAKRLRSLAG